MGLRPPAPRLRAAPRLRGLSAGQRRAARPELVALLALAGALHLWALTRNGLANAYYAGAVRSMADSWPAFLYGSFDASDVMTVDKPPLALWVQALSARVLGFGSFALLLPQALMGVASVGLTYDVVRRPFGRGAGFAGGLVLALTPVSVAVARHNNPDALLVLCVVAAVWCAVRWLADPRTRWLVLCGAAVGLGFEAKMGAALLVVPGIVAAVVWVAPDGLRAAVRQLVAGGGVLLGVALAWPVLVWLTPAGSRPWVSGTDDNSMWSLILGYNGLGRLAGQDGGPGAGGADYGGGAGPTRLLNEAVGGQGGWILGAAVVAALALAVLTRGRRADPRTGWLLVVGGAFAVTAVAFSQAQGIFHPYYVSALAPFTAALVGAGAGIVLTGGPAAPVVGPLLVAAGAITSLAVIGEHPRELGWLRPVLFASGIAAAIALAAERGDAIRRGALVLGLGVLLLGPAIWSVQTLGHRTSGTFPTGGPRWAGMPDVPASTRFGSDAFGLDAALAHAAAHGGGTVAVASQSAAALPAAAGADIAAIGGFSGRETQVSVAWLADAVAAGKVRWVLARPEGRGGADPRIGAATALAAAARAGRPVPGIDGLVDLAGRADALRRVAREGRIVAP